MTILLQRLRRIFQSQHVWKVVKVHKKMESFNIYNWAEEDCVTQLKATALVEPVVRLWHLVLCSYHGSVHRGPPGSSGQSDKRPCGAHSDSCRFYHCCRTLTSCGAYSSGMRKGKFEYHKSFFSLPLSCNVTWSLQSHTPDTHLYTQTAGLPFLCNGTLSAGPTEHVGTHFALALQLLKEKKHNCCLFRNSVVFYRFHTQGGAVALLQ